MKTPFPLAGRKVIFFFKNWPTFNFMNGVHRQKKTRKQKVCNYSKTVSTSQNEGLVEKYE